MRHTPLVLLLFALSAGRAEAGGPNVEMKACTVDKVEVEDEKIVLTVSGRCSLVLPDPDREKGGAKSVDTLLDRCVITMNRKDLRLHLRLEGDKWSEYQKVARALDGKTVWMQLRAVVTLDHERVDSMRCTSVLFGEVSARRAP